MSETESWYVVRQAEGQCQVVSASQVNSPLNPTANYLEQWGPFVSQGEAIAKRVGLIRAGKCKPA